ncbi:hypothetical protein [Actinomadura sp. WAC 06369]|uniref:hypothetical protein n=1 Tax=Actinomadura sp. WAC 06369 TaxID=2203193 RepID=UPI000F78F214|nr:hypothetical protein [Actinomadura sp. WAC 06369]RSN66251.1 hypothetical protein DMH08_16670 [Actinomadura sp. WAC 06369]
MPSKDHELPLEMVRNQPDLVPELLRSVFHEDIPEIPEGDASLTSETYNAFHPQELRCDATVLVGDPEKPSLGIIVESQLRDDPSKGFSWPAYVANVRLRHKCDTILLVFCPDERVARACARPILMGHPELILKPLTFHPGLVGPITDPERARKVPELVILSTPAHADGPHRVAVLDSYNAAIDHVAQVQGVAIATQYHDHTTPQLSAVARKLMEERMQAAGYEWKSEFAIHHRAEGKAEGKAEGRTEEAAKLVLRILQKRGVCVSDDARRRITECTDLEQLEEWVLDAGTVASVDELFTG